MYNRCGGGGGGDFSPNPSLCGGPYCRNKDAEFKEYSATCIYKDHHRDQQNMVLIHRWFYMPVH